LNIFLYMDVSYSRKNITLIFNSQQLWFEDNFHFLMLAEDVDDGNEEKEEEEKNYE
jgi:hypothetical protein